MTMKRSILLTALTLLAAFSRGGLDVRVDGLGVLRFDQGGVVVYAKKAHLTVKDGLLGCEDASLLPQISVPDSVGAIKVDLEGNVFGAVGNKMVSLGRLVLAEFPQENVLVPNGSFLVAQDRPRLVEPGSGTYGVIRLIEKTVKPLPVTEAKTTLAPKPSLILPMLSTKPLVAPYHAVPSATPVQTATSKLVINVRRDSTVNSEKFTLQDIANLDGSKEAVEAAGAITVGDSPVYGISRGLDAFTIEARMVQAGYRKSDYILNVPDQAKLTRQAQMIAADRFIEKAVEAAKAQSPSSAFHCSDSQTNFAAPVGTAELMVESCQLSKQGATVVIAVNVDGKRINSRTINLVTDKPLPNVTAYTPVKVLLHCGSVVVEVPGKTRSAGYVGQTVEVQTETGSIHTGTVTAPDQVDVNLS
jgi:hypothetical protein